MTCNPDDYLIKQVSNDDVGAFEVLYKKHYRMVYNYARHFINDPTTCQDVVQDVFTYIWESRHKLEIKKSFKSYLMSACHNTCLNHLNKQRVKQKHVTQIINRSGNYHDGYDVIFEDELKEAIDNAMEDFPEQCREVFILSRMKGLKHKEIGKILNISPKTVETQIYRALKMLKKKLVITFFIIFYNLF